MLEPVPANPPLKEALQSSATIGEDFTYYITVPGTRSNDPLYDVRLFDDLAATTAELEFVRAEVAPVSDWTGTLQTSVTAGNLEIWNDVGGIDIQPGKQAVIAVTARLRNTDANRVPQQFTNTAWYNYNTADNQPVTQATIAADPAVSAADMSVIEPDVTMVKEVSNVTTGKALTDPAAYGDTLEYKLLILNNGDSPANDVNVTDTLPAGLGLVVDSATALINGIAVGGFNRTPNSDALTNTHIWGRQQ